MIDHVGLPVTDLERSKRFYKEALAPLGYALLREYPGVAGFGPDQKPDFWMREFDAVTQVHVAIEADREAVDAFHAAAMSAGGTDNGAPGVREIYHPHYYGAFVLDPDGHNIEAVCHRPG
jgi:catechol 2,3-dioxygenase-like lactoylglutathione lyase family enzyme